MSDLLSMRNIGKEIEKKLNFIGIASAKELKDIGSKDAYIRLKYQYPNVCLVHLYVLEGAIIDIDYNKLSDETKLDLKKFNDGIE